VCGEVHRKDLVSHSSIRMVGESGATFEALRGIENRLIDFLKGSMCGKALGEACLRSAHFQP